MDHFLKPKDLETSPEDPEAATAFKYWLATFETFRIGKPYRQAKLR